MDEQLMGGTVDATRETPDNWWWLAVIPAGGNAHLYELGYSTYQDILDDEGRPTGGRVAVTLTDQRHAEILSGLGLGPGSADWTQEVLCGRPNRYLEPREYGPDGALLPIRARDGVTLHLIDGE